VKLTKVTKTIIAKDSSDWLRKCIAELEREKDTMQRAMDLNTVEYDLVVAGNKKLASEMTN
jgi:hypothetical protein